MIKKPTEDRNFNQYALATEAKHIAMLNEALGDLNFKPCYICLSKGRKV